MIIVIKGTEGKSKAHSKKKCVNTFEKAKKVFHWIKAHPFVVYSFRETMTIILGSVQDTEIILLHLFPC